MVSQSSVLAKLMVLRMDSLVSPGRPRMKSAWMVRPRSWQSLAKARALDGGALLDVLEDLRVAGLEADDEQAAAGFLHGLEGVVVGGDARGAAPGEVERLQLFAELDGAGLLDVEGVVVEEELLHLGEVLLGPCEFRGHVVGGALAPGVTAEGLRPEAEGALRRAAARGVKRDVRVKQEGDVVAGDVHVALVDLGGPGHGVEVFNLGTIGIVDDLAIELVADAEDLVEWLSLGKLDDGVVELAAADEVEGGTLVEGAIRVGGHRRPDEGDFDGGVDRLDGLGEALVAFPADGRGEEYQELVVLADLDGFVGGDVVRGRIEKAGTLKQACRVCEPDGVPIGLDFARGGPARTRASVKVLKRGGIQEQRLQRHRHHYNSTIR